MTRLQLNREQWWLLCATYAVALFVQRDNLREPNTVTAFLAVGALLLTWRLNHATMVPADAAARRPVVAMISVIAGLSLGTLIVNNWPSSQDHAATSSAAFQDPASPPASPPGGSQGVTQQPDAPSVGPAPGGQAPISPFDLLSEFQANDFLADQKYHGRFIRVVGEITGVERAPNEVAFVELSLRPKRLIVMQALFPKNAGQIKGLKQGDHVTLSCSPQYDEDIDNVTLNDCSLVK